MLLRQSSPNHAYAFDVCGGPTTGSHTPLLLYALSAPWFSGGGEEGMFPVHQSTSIGMTE